MPSYAALISVPRANTKLIIRTFPFAPNRADLDRSMFLPWVAWTGVFAGIFLILMSICGMCRIIRLFTLLSGETFSMLVTVLFLQQAITVS